MGNVRVRARAASAKLEQLQAASEDGWKALVADMERMRKDVTHSFQELKGRL
jgi:hypothetical protein